MRATATFTRWPISLMRKGNLPGRYPGVGWVVSARLCRICHNSRGRLGMEWGEVKLCCYDACHQTFRWKTGGWKVMQGQVSQLSKGAKFEPFEQSGPSTVSTYPLFNDWLCDKYLCQCLLTKTWGVSTPTLWGWLYDLWTKHTCCRGTSEWMDRLGADLFCYDCVGLSKVCHAPHIS